MEDEFTWAASQWIVEHRQAWDREHPKHIVIVEDFNGKVIAEIPDDNSVMGACGPMWTPEAVKFFRLHPFGDNEIYTIDGTTDDGGNI